MKKGKVNKDGQQDFFYEWTRVSSCVGCNYFNSSIWNDHNLELLGLVAYLSFLPVASEVQPTTKLAMKFVA